MPGLVGTYFRNKDLSDRFSELTKEMCHLLTHENWYKFDTSISEHMICNRISLGILNPEKQPIYNKDKSKSIMMDGEIFNAIKLRNRLIEKGHQFSIGNDPEIILHAYEEFGESVIPDLNGSFIAIIYNTLTNELIIFNDRFGSRPLYYYECCEYMLFAPEVKAILADNTFSRSLDEEGIAEYFAFGYLLNEKTFFKEIKLLMSASILKINAKGSKITKYWDLVFEQSKKEQDESFYVKEVGELWLQAVERRMQGNHRFIFSLSGGLDSRLIIGAVDKKHYPIKAMSFGYTDCRDVKYAKMITKKLDIEHLLYELPEDYLVDNAEKIVWLSDGMWSCINASDIVIHNEIMNKADILFDGYFMGPCMGYRLLNEEVLALNDRNSFEKLTCKKHAHSLKMLRNILNKDFYDFVQTYSYKKISSLSELLTDRKYMDKYISFFLKNDQPRLTLNGPVMQRKYFEVRLPMLDYELVDIILKVPSYYRAMSRLRIGLIKTYFPELANVPYKDTGLPLTVNKQRYINNMFLSKIYARYNFYLLRAGIKISRNKENFLDQDYAFRNNHRLRKYIKSILLDNRTLNRGFFNAEEIDKLINDISKINAESIGIVLTFELFNRLFIDQQSR